MTIDRYVLKTGEAARETLEAQQSYLADASYEQLAIAGLKEGQTVWDVGCGVGVMTEYLAKAVGSGGCVYALDISKNQLEVTKERIEKSGLNNVIYIQGNISEMEELPLNSADIVYSRLILMHLQKPKEAIEKMHSLLKPNGILTLQESTISTSLICEGGVKLADYFETLIKVGEKIGVDFNIGTKLPSICEELGYKVLKAYPIVHKHTAKQAKFMLLSWLSGWQVKAIETELATSEKIETWKDIISTIPEDDTSIYFLGAEQMHVLVGKDGLVSE